MNDKLLTKKAYLIAEPQGKYTTTSYGDLWHYPAIPQGEPANDAQKAAKDLGGSVISTDDLPDDLEL